MADPDFIDTEMVAVNPDGSQVDVVVRIGKPVPDDRGVYVCGALPTLQGSSAS